MRMTKDEYYLNLAKAVSQRSSCFRRQYGAVIVKNDIVLSSGYNGPPRGDINCDETMICPRMQKGIAHNTAYTSSDCRAIHAETNALMSIDRQDAIGATLYLYGYDCAEEKEIVDAEPCEMCKLLIKNSGIKYVISRKNLVTIMGTDEECYKLYNGLSEEDKQVTNEFELDHKAFPCVFRRVYLIQGVPVGFIRLIKTDETDDNTCSVGIIVKKEYRNQGIGTCLTQMALEWFKGSNFQTLQWKCASSNEASKKIALDNGFEILVQEPDCLTLTYAKNTSEKCVLAQ